MQPGCQPQAVLALKGLDRTDAVAVMADLHRRQENVLIWLCNAWGASRMNLKQAYRHVPLLERRPLKIGFTWSKQRRGSSAHRVLPWLGNCWSGAWKHRRCA